MNNQQAINLLKGLEQSLDDYCELNNEGKTAFGMAITALELFGNSEQLPSAQPERRWIPCSERLPENGRQVLVFARSVHFALAKYDEMREADGTYKKQWVTFDAWKPFYTIKDVIAWMPLPAPYKED